MAVVDSGDDRGQVRLSTGELVKTSPHLPLPVRETYRREACDPLGMRLAMTALVTVLTPLEGGCGGSESPGDGTGTPRVKDLRRAVETDATCAELVEMKNAMDPKSADYTAAPDVLRSVGCYAVTSERIDR